MKHLSKLILGLFAILLMSGCNNADNIIPYTLDETEVEKNFDGKDGILIVGNPKDKLVEDMTNGINDDKYKDFELKIADASDKNLKENEGIINVIKKGKIIGYFDYTDKNKAENLLKHALRMHNGESYVLNDKNFDSLSNVINLNNKKLESTEDSKKFLNQKGTDNKFESCKVLKHMNIYVEKSNVNDFNCKDHDERTLDLMKDKSYALNDNSFNLFEDAKLKDSNYDIKPKRGMLGYVNSFEILNDKGETKFKPEIDNEGQFYEFYNDDDKRFAYIMLHNMALAREYYIFDKLDNKAYRSIMPILENNGVINFVNKDGLAAYDIENDKAYSVASFKSNENGTIIGVIDFDSAINTFILTGAGYDEKDKDVIINIDKMEPLDVNWTSKLEV